MKNDVLKELKQELAEQLKEESSSVHGKGMNKKNAPNINTPPININNDCFQHMLTHKLTNFKK
jgi:hypothetical protein